MELELEGGAIARVDEEDLMLFRSRSWRVLEMRTVGGRVYRYLASGRILLHRLMVGAAEDQVVDHVDGDGLNNTRQNIRVCSHAENMRNRRPNIGKALPKGVARAGRGFSAQIKSGSTRLFKRGFQTPEAASECYQAWARSLHGDFAYTPSGLTSDRVTQLMQMVYDRGNL